MKANKSGASLLMEGFLTLLAIPVGFMLALCDIAKKQR